MTARLAVLISGHGSNLQAIIDACATHELDAQIVLVVSNKTAAYGLERARLAGLPTQSHLLKPYKDSGRSRTDYDADLAEIVGAAQPDWVILAGWMYVLSMAFLSKFPNRVVNLHPALPGQFAGTEAIHRAFEAFQRGEITHTGLMVHLVPDEGIDVGPVLRQAIVPIYPTDTLEALESRMHTTEHKTLVAAIRDLVGESQRGS
jgi:formyltetrahydrofolate-dependent phosphoribosylglycinamide formyltransferase